MTNELSEGQVKFRVGDTFYRPNNQIARDLGVLAAAIYKQDKGYLRVLDAMTGCGVRALRYWRESGADWILANDSNPENEPILKDNLKEIIDNNQGKIIFQDANKIFFECYNNKDYYDLVDVDAFGSPAPYLQTMLYAAKIGGLLYLTSTDGKTASGHLPINSLKLYGVYARCHPASQEQVLRLLIGNIQQQAASLGLGIEPIFSLFLGQTYRIMVRLLKNSNLTLENYGFLGYCHHCGEYQTVSWQQLGKVNCPFCLVKKEQSTLILSGSLWLGNLHNCQYLKRMKSLAQQLGWLKQVDLLAMMENESEFPPYFYTLGEIGRRGKIDIPPRNFLLQALQEKGYRATATPINLQAIKTNASLLTCIEIAKSSK